MRRAPCDSLMQRERPGVGRGDVTPERDVLYLLRDRHKPGTYFQTLAAVLQYNGQETPGWALLAPKAVLPSQYRPWPSTAPKMEVSMDAQPVVPVEVPQIRALRADHRERVG